MKTTVEQILGAVTLAMGVAVVAISILDGEFSVMTGIRLLGVGLAASGVLALLGISKKA